MQKQIDELKHENDVLHDELLKARLLSSPSYSMMHLTTSSKRSHYHHTGGLYLSKSAPSTPEHSRMSRRPSELSAESIASDDLGGSILPGFDGVTDGSGASSCANHSKGKCGRKGTSLDGWVG